MPLVSAFEELDGLELEAAPVPLSPSTEESETARDMGGGRSIVVALLSDEVGDDGSDDSAEPFVVACVATPLDGAGCNGG